MRSKRITWFFIMIALGVTAGLAYGWIIDPVQYTDTTPDSLHPDYKADYTLMVAEIFKADGDLPGAQQRLSFLGPLPPDRIVAESLITARAAGYAPQDITLLESLAKAVQANAAPVPFSGDQP
jgi:hypothetical protein